MSSIQLDEHRLVVSLDAAQTEVAALGRERGPAATVSEAIIHRDSVAKKWARNQAKKTRKYVEGREMMVGKKMVAEDRESEIQRVLELAASRTSRAEVALAAAHDSGGPPVPKNLFGTGQSVLQWWASWFAKCAEGETPKRIGKKLRPSWYSADITSYVGHQTIVYAGVRTTGHCYTVA
jgi:hypothetical protein